MCVFVSVGIIRLDNPLISEIWNQRRRRSLPDQHSPSLHLSTLFPITEWQFGGLWKQSTPETLIQRRTKEGNWCKALVPDIDLGIKALVSIPGNKHVYFSYIKNSHKNILITIKAFFFYLHMENKPRHCVYDKPSWSASLLVNKRFTLNLQ